MSLSVVIVTAALIAGPSLEARAADVVFQVSKCKVGYEWDAKEEEMRPQGAGLLSPGVALVLPTRHKGLPARTFSWVDLSNLQATARRSRASPPHRRLWRRRPRRGLDGSAQYAVERISVAELKGGERLVWLRYDGIIKTNEPWVLFHGNRQLCLGSVLLGTDGKELEGAGTCTAHDEAGDSWSMW